MTTTSRLTGRRRWRSARIVFSASAPINGMCSKSRMATTWRRSTEAIQAAKLDPRPSLIACRTHIGFGAPHKQDTAKAHGEPLGDEELDEAKQNLGWPLEPRFLVPPDVLDFFRRAVADGQRAEDELEQTAQRLREGTASGRREICSGASRASCPKTGIASCSEVPGRSQGHGHSHCLGQSAFGALGQASGTDRRICRPDAIQQHEVRRRHRLRAGQRRSGRYVHFGVREHAMAAALNGMTLYGGLIPYGGTFLIFSDYMRPALRIAALSHIPSIFVFTHDSVGLGEDGPTHQPIEHLASLRAMPNMLLIRPGGCK